MLVRESGRRACVLLGPSPSGLPRVLRRALGVQPGSPRPRRLGRAGGEARVPTATLTHGRPLADSSRTTSLALPRAPLASGLGGTRRQPLPAGQKGALRAGGAPRQQPQGGGLGEQGPAAAPPPPLAAPAGWRPPGAGGTGRAALLVCPPLPGSASRRAGWALRRGPGRVLSSDLRSQGRELGET